MDWLTVALLTFHLLIKMFRVVKEVQATWWFSSPNIEGQLPGTPKI